MAKGALWPVCLLACFLIAAPGSESPPLQKIDAGAAAAAAKNVHAPPVAARALWPPLIEHDGLLVSCTGEDLLAFGRDGSIAWALPIGRRCNDGIGPFSEGGKVYVVAEDKVIKVTPEKIYTLEPASEVFFALNATPGRSEEIIGMSIISGFSYLFLTIRNRGLFAFSLQGKLQWSIGPVIDRLGCRLGCKGNVSSCYFDLAPVLDHCEGALYISNTEGQLYSLYIDTPQFRWVQDLSSIDRVMTIAPGNSGCLYLVFPRKSIVVGLDVSTGNILWQQNIGPLSNEKVSPAVDSNGWMSIGSIDGTLYSVSPDGDIRKLLGKTGLDSVIHAGPVLDCSGFCTYVAQTIVERKSIRTIGDLTYVSATNVSHILFTLLAPATGTIYWTGEYPGELSNLLSSGDMNDFIGDETILLTLLSAARIGNAMPCYMRGRKISWTCRHAKAKFAQADSGGHNHNIMLLAFLLMVIVIQEVVVWSCCIFWRKRKLQGNGLQKFLEKRSSLHSRRRALGKMISELEQKAAEDASSNEVLGQLGDMVKTKESVEKKLYASYSLGRDRPAGLKQQGSSSLPLYHSHSFHSSQKETITIFNTFSDTSTSEDDGSCCSDGSESCCSGTSSGDVEGELDARSRPAEEAGPSKTANVGEAVQDEK
ncbi:hypothetical protein BS78_03G187600 [Paspalum vaginatum]|nr:hypothetical protein BS78_03G187600 [Paspalum vaginatum]